MKGKRPACPVSFNVSPPFAPRCSERKYQLEKSNFKAPQPINCQPYYYIRTVHVPEGPILQPVLALLTLYAWPANVDAPLNEIIIGGGEKGGSKTASFKMATLLISTN